MQQCRSQEARRLTAPARLLLTRRDHLYHRRMDDGRPTELTSDVSTSYGGMPSATWTEPVAAEKYVVRLRPRP